MESFTPGQLSLTSGGPKDEARLLTRDRVIKDWPGWHLEIKITERRLTEGVMHQGLASVIQVLGRSPEN
ncbi:MAG: hypothetical protein CR979_03345 [Propionibacterium sp.]|nr:MAG: hypothetical protein CR979_03345 [Propionibacterium sp.]